jgi:MtN3 and saliva related transmembrane protein
MVFSFDNFWITMCSHIGHWLSPADDPYAWVGYSSTALAALCYIPQIVKIRKTQSSKDISFWLFALWIMGSSVWITYGIRTVKWPIIWINVLNLFFRIWVLSYKIIIDRKNLKNRD